MLEGSLAQTGLPVIRAIVTREMKPFASGNGLDHNDMTKVQQDEPLTRFQWRSNATGRTTAGADGGKVTPETPGESAHVVSLFWG